MTPTPAVSAKGKAREAIKDAIRRACADEVNGRPNGDILVKGCTHAEYIDPEDAAASFVDGIADEVFAALSATEGEAEPVATANCCQCGRIVDTREKADGGDDFGCETTDGRWTCSPECWEIATGGASPPSAPAGVNVKPLEFVYSSDGTLDSAVTPGGMATVWAVSGGWMWKLGDVASGKEYTRQDAHKMLWATYEQRIRSSLQPDTQAAASAPAGEERS